jgi:hypothetical protein
LPIADLRGGQVTTLFHRKNRKSAIGNRQFFMWDRKRQIVWIAAGLILGTYISYSDSLDEQGNFVPQFFVFMEALVLIIMGVLFYLYSRKKG